MIYFDTCALLKLILKEDHGDELRAYLKDHRYPWVSSELIVVETHRTLYRVHHKDLNFYDHLCAEANHVLDTVTLCTVSEVRDLAAGMQDDIKSLDAIHLATALTYRPQVFITYDQKLATLAEDQGLTVLAPGWDDILGK